MYHVFTYKYINNNYLDRIMIQLYLHDLQNLHYIYVLALPISCLLKINSYSISLTNVKVMYTIELKISSVFVIYSL